jgi:hypothetical protein
MPQNAEIFRASIGKWAKATDAKFEALARQTCYEMGFRVVQKTPVDTGFLRGSWQPSIGEAMDATPTLDTAGARALGDVGIVIQELKVGDRFFMVNNAAYARFVEYGTSRMGPRYYVTDTVKAWQSVVSQVAGELGLAS